MADLKIQGVSPAAGKIKLGSSDVAKIYKGSTLVWPISGGGACTGHVFADKAALVTAVNLWISNNAQAIIDYGQINTWCTQNVTDMSYLFQGKLYFNDDISNWDVSNVTNMEGMFKNNLSTIAAFNKPLNSWDVSNVTDMNYMFFRSYFNQNLSSWDVSNVTSTQSMFGDCINFNQDLSAWDVSSVTSMLGMFNKQAFLAGSSAFNNGQAAGIVNWDVSNVTDMRLMFSGASSFNQDLSGWCVSYFSSEPYLFKASSALTAANTPVWGTCP